MNSMKFKSINMFSCVGCWFGVKNHDKLGVFLPNIAQAQLAAADVEDSAGKLAQALCCCFLISNSQTVVLQSLKRPGLLGLTP